MNHHKLYHKPTYSAWHFWLLLPFAILLLNSCKKENLDYTYDYRRNTDASKESSVRLVNLSQNQQLIVNGDSLTNFFLPPTGNAPIDQTISKGTRYFPADGRLSLTWRMPQELLSADGSARIKTSYLANRPALTHDAELTVKEDPSQARDYYLLINHPDAAVGVKDFVEIPRDVTAPSKPDHFKIRLLNLSLKFPANNPMEDISSAYTLTYADGTPLSAATSGIQPGSRSDYIEVPYGTYQFKVLTADGRQVPAVGQEYYSYIVTSLSTMAAAGAGTDGQTTSGQTFAPINTFQPGGVYTIVVHPAAFTWSSGNDDISNLQNGFRIIADISEPENTTYARVQLANAIPESQLQLRVNSKSTAATAYSTASEYQNVIKGKQFLQVVNASGQTIVSQEADLLPGGNYTLWTYPAANNTATAVLVSNSLSGTWFTGQNNDGGNASMDRMRSKYYFNFRFLNLCPEVPYVTFTNGQGVPYRSNTNVNSGTNLQTGFPLVDDPYARLAYEGGDFYQIMAYASGLNRVPGDWLSAVTPINSRERLVARPALYTSVNRIVPAHEPGAYSIALVGRQQATGTGSAAKLMIVKHTK